MDCICSGLAVAFRTLLFVHSFFVRAFLFRIILPWIVYLIRINGRTVLRSHGVPGVRSLHMVSAAGYLWGILELLIISL